jgi:hypothetical protein
MYPPRFFTLFAVPLNRFFPDCLIDWFGFGLLARLFVSPVPFTSEEIKEGVVLIHEGVAV